MSVSRILKWVTGSFEAILAIPLIGASIVVGSVYIALAVMLILHIITLVLTKRDGGKTVGSILVIVPSFIVWRPFVGFIMHILSAILLMVNASEKDPVNNTEQISSEEMHFLNTFLIIV